VNRYKVRFTPRAEEDLLRLYDFLLEKDVAAAERALDAIKGAVELLQFSPFSCRKALTDNPFLRELVIPFGSTGYVALFEIESGNTVSILAVRHQREEDYQ
jgi:plasmid stabilization system protein ParE